MANEPSREACRSCNGDGIVFNVPSTCNPFFLSVEQIAKASRKQKCWICQGTGRAPAEKEER